MPYLVLLDEHRVKYRVVMGVWAGGRENTFKTFRLHTAVREQLLPLEVLLELVE